MANDRLRSALASAGMTTDDLGARIEVDPKTVERWIANGRVPHRSNRQRGVGADPGRELPVARCVQRHGLGQRSQAEVLTVYPNRGSIPVPLWHSLFEATHESIDILAFAASFLHDTLPDLDEILVGKARAGVRIRLAFGDPDSTAVQIRGDEEGIGASLAERCRLTWKYLEQVLPEPGIEARAQTSTLYCSMFRFDDDLMANHHLLGAPANHRRSTHQTARGRRLFDHHLKSFERAWGAASERRALRPGTPARRRRLWRGSDGGDFREGTRRQSIAVVGPKAPSGRLEEIRGSAFDFRNHANYIAESLLEAGGFRPEEIHWRSGMSQQTSDNLTNTIGAIMPPQGDAACLSKPFKTFH